MKQENTDPRILRTRQLIMDSFVDQSGKKEFKDITIKDITTAAQINRSTFYYHFVDIYDLLDKALTEVLFVNLRFEDYKEKVIDEETLVSIFKSITNFQVSLSNRCHRGYEDTIARIIRDQLEVIFGKMLANEYPTGDETGIQRTAKLLSWGMYGASVECRKLIEVTSPEDYIKSTLPYMFLNKQTIER